MPPLTVRMFGKFCMRRDGDVIAGLDASKLQELFSYLAIYRGSPHSRESLAALLWGDCSTAQSKTYLRKALWQIQSALDQNGRSHERALHVEPDWVSLNPTAKIWLDVAVFEQAFDAAREVSGHELGDRVAQALEQAVQLYRGDLLEGCYQDWCLCERERLQSNYLIMLDKMMGYCEAHHQYETGLGYGLQVLRYDRARESTHRRLMRLYYLAGDRTSALRQYVRCRAALAEELAVEPARRTTELYEQIRADEFKATTIQALPSRQPPRESPPPLPEVIGHLHQLRAALTDIQLELQRDIQVVDLALEGRYKSVGR